MVMSVHSIVFSSPPPLYHENLAPEQHNHNTTRHHTAAGYEHTTVYYGIGKRSRRVARPPRVTV